jgi:hypothetical protein
MNFEKIFVIGGAEQLDSKGNIDSKDICFIRLD